ncbi:hypothetical protein KPB04_13550 [Burkholderia cenocepacia]|uniref:hypothetical protein n=1 Tax=Burkholderia cenocepacia TaxID=95486 RepID=UPI002859B9C8|nr:hypothetical protein [Burkholderia cenocepacia]MDR8102756.1 hypothetical protein [Burkholderia cenocepacia]
MNWWLTIPSWLVAGYFGIGFIVKAGFPPKTELLIGDALFVVLTLFFLFLPFFNKLKIGSWIELEREVKEAKTEAATAKEELREFKNEMRNTMSAVSTNLTAQRVSTQVHVHGASPEQLREAQRRLGENLNPGDQSTVEKYERTTRVQQDGDVPLMLAKVRMDIERLLRRIVGARLVVANSGDDPIKFATMRQLFGRFIQTNPSYEYLAEPFKYVNNVCNAAIHAQSVSEEQADEALRLGAQIIEVLGKHQDASDGELASA